MTIRLARSSDAQALAAVHVAAWRSAYAGILPSGYLAGLSAPRHAAQFHASIARGRTVLVAEEGTHVVGYCTAGRPRAAGLAEGEVETLYVLDDHRDQGHGRALLQAAAARLAGQSCRSLFLWVLEDNPNRWFYQRLGGRPARTGSTHVAGRTLTQIAYVWDPITLLLTANARL